MKSLKRYIGACVAALLAGIVSAETADLGVLLPSLKEGGYVIVLRHGATNAEQKDIYPLSFGDMSKQRQLSEQGKEDARQIGSAMKTLRIPIGKVLTSHLNRAVETGRLIAERDVTWKEELNDSGMGSASAMTESPTTVNERYGSALRHLAASRPDPRTNTLIVTHKTNIQDAFGKQWSDIQEGETLLFKPDGSASPVPVARVKANDWIKLARVQ
jgi:broad specificity phosphatase PhoE